MRTAKKAVLISWMLVLWMLSAAWGEPARQTVFPGSQVQVHQPANARLQKKLEKCQKRCNGDPICLNTCRGSYKIHSRTERNKLHHAAPGKCNPVLRY